MARSTSPSSPVSRPMPNGMPMPSGNGASMMDSGPPFPPPTPPSAGLACGFPHSLISRCQSSSVTNGMMGCSIRSRASMHAARTRAAVSRSERAPRSLGFENSMYTSQNSETKNDWMADDAPENRYASRDSLTRSAQLESRPRIHSSARQASPARCRRRSASTACPRSQSPLPPSNSHSPLPSPSARSDSTANAVNLAACQSLLHMNRWCWTRLMSRLMESP
mmetsp:Transcript_15415/g.37889  ORF Transcript_15415/g.37889 Transcript_15415/m.37889 type:complete len:222 (+) Transcript_15415:246-911(+)